MENIFITLSYLLSLVLKYLVTCEFLLKKKLQIWPKIVQMENFADYSCISYHYFLVAELLAAVTISPSNLDAVDLETQVSEVGHDCSLPDSFF